MKMSTLLNQIGPDNNVYCKNCQANEYGNFTKPNDLRCLSIEKKLGIKGSPTAVMQYGEAGGAVGYLVGAENHGIDIMFAMMNHP